MYFTIATQRAADRTGRKKEKPAREKPAATRCVSSCELVVGDADALL